MKKHSFRPLVPNFVTMLALVSGVSAIHMAIWGRWSAAILCLFASGIFDFLDGKVARLLSVSSRFGAELDSLSDFVCFGLAPGLILYHWTMDPSAHLAALSHPALKAEAVGLHWGFVLILAACCAGRLARFNAALDEEEPPYWEHFFVGVPAPAGGFLALAPLVFALAVPQWEGWFRHSWVVSAFVLFAALAMASRVPTVVMNVSGGGIDRRKESIAFVKSDSSAVGREAAHTLLRQGVYKSYGYAGYRTDDEWSRNRGEAFRAALRTAGFSGKMFDRERYKDRREDKATLVRWLDGLPKPCGILAACDDRAFEILDVCRERGIKIPAEIGILGVNNDPILCENAEPRLSSVQPDFTHEGYLAAQLLDHGLAKHRGKTVFVGVKQVVCRYCGKLFISYRETNQPRTYCSVSCARRATNRKWRAEHAEEATS